MPNPKVVIAALLALLVLLAPAAIAQATAPAADPSLEAAARALPGVLASDGEAADYFAPTFRQAVPAAALAPLLEQLRDTLGAPQRLTGLIAQAPYVGTATIAFARGSATVRLAVDPVAPHAVTGLLITGTQASDDTIDKLIADLRALPGASGFGIYRLSDDAPRLIAGWRSAEAAPVGSSFKLWVLAEAARQVAAGERRWTDVVPLGRASLPSGVLQDWPLGTPLTLQSLATLMISLSDNTAADTLLTVLGPARVDAMVATAGAAHPAATLPVLTTREAFAIKIDPALAAAWPSASPAGRRRLLATHRGQIDAASLSADAFGGRPLASDTVEWFASPDDMARLLDWLRIHGDAATRAIMAVNSGTDATTTASFGYVGFKGGSEPGVIALNYLVRTTNGQWLAVTGNWHRTDGDTPALRFGALMSRALALARTAR